MDIVVTLKGSFNWESKQENGVVVWDDDHQASCRVEYTVNGQKLETGVTLWIRGNNINDVQKSANVSIPNGTKIDMSDVINKYKAEVQTHFGQRNIQVLDYKQKQYPKLWVHAFINELRKMDAKKRKLSSIECSISLQDYLKPSMSLKQDNDFYVVVYSKGVKTSIANRSRYSSDRPYALYVQHGRNSKCADAKGAYASITRRSVKSAERYVERLVNNVRSANQRIMNEIEAKAEFTKHFPNLNIEVSTGYGASVIKVDKRQYSISKNGNDEHGNQLWNFNGFNKVTKEQVIALLKVFHPTVS